MEKIINFIFIIAIIALGSALIMCSIGISYQLSFHSVLADWTKATTIFGTAMMLIAFILFVWDVTFNE